MSGPYRKSVFCADVRIGDRVHEVFCLARVERRAKSGGESFLRLSLADRSGEIAGVAWDDVDALVAVLVEGGYARVLGEVGDFRGAPQIKVLGAEPVEGPLDPEDFLARGPVEPAVSIAGIRALVATIGDRWLRALVDSFLDDPAFAAAFAAAPAAKANHHAYVGGLAEHTLSVMRLCDDAARHYAGVDRDLLLTGAFCHDLGKTVELAVAPGFPYTERGSLLGHIAIGFAMVRERAARIPGFPDDRATDLGHLVLSHQGELAWGSPVVPLTLEAIVLHFLDNLDSKAATARAHLAAVDSGRTAYVRALGRSLFRRPAAPVAEEPSAEVPPVGAPPREAPAAPPSGAHPSEGAEPGPSLFDFLDTPPD